MKSYRAIGADLGFGTAERSAKETFRIGLWLLGTPVLALLLAMPTAHAQDRAKEHVSRGGDHPAVIVARRGAQVDPASVFYPHPAWLCWSLQRPSAEHEEPTLPVATGERDSANNAPQYCAMDSRLGTASRETR
jgi:hypothetical protein